MQQIHHSVQEGILSEGKEGFIGYQDFKYLIEYLSIAPIRVLIRGDLGPLMVGSLENSESMKDEERLDAVVELVKLMAVRPDLDGLLHEFEFNKIHRFDHLVKLAEQNKDAGQLAMLKIAGADMSVSLSDLEP